MMTDMHENSRELDQCLTIIRAFDPKQVILFGSRARGDYRPDSDIDLMVIKEEIKDKKEEILALYRALWQHKLYPDIVLVTSEHFEEWRETTNHICNEAALDGKVVYEKVA